MIGQGTGNIDLISRPFLKCLNKEHLAMENFKKIMFFSLFEFPTLQFSHKAGISKLYLLFLIISNNKNIINNMLLDKMDLRLPVVLYIFYTYTILAHCMVSTFVLITSTIV